MSDDLHDIDITQMADDLCNAIHRNGIADLLAFSAIPRCEKIEERMAKMEKRVEEIEVLLRENNLLLGKSVVAGSQHIENDFDNLSGVL